MFGSGESSSITRGPQSLPMSNVISPLPFEIDAWIALRSEPLPVSFVFETVCTKPSGAASAIAGWHMTAAQTGKAHAASVFLNAAENRRGDCSTMRIASSPYEARRLAPECYTQDRRKSGELCAHAASFQGYAGFRAAFAADLLVPSIAAIPRS
jgi:hypothetical protein